ncbi:MAG: hypothetical protein CMI16_03340 [Opitutaceae bacterium]|nr:hypothetical protein [Opitutaceae bacterium]|tara:strand:+ start:256 stop:936 length:681 start_codon:yes stop_codon:yes gene_type:complete
MSVRKQQPANLRPAEERRDLYTVSSNERGGGGSEGGVMRTVALQLKPEVEEALCNLSLSASGNASGNAQYRQLGRLRAQAAAAEQNRASQMSQRMSQPRREMVRNEEEEEDSTMSDAMRLATGVANTRAAEAAQYEFADISDTSQAGRLIRGLGGTPADYGVMVESKAGRDPALHFYPATENDVNPTTRSANYTQLQHDSFVALVKTYKMDSFEKLADTVDGVTAA